MKMDNRAPGPQIDELLKHTRCCNGDLIRLETSPISRGIGQIVVWQVNNQFDNTIYAISTQAWAKNQQMCSSIPQRTDRSQVICLATHFLRIAAFSSERRKWAEQSAINRIAPDLPRPMCRSQNRVLADF